MSYDLINVTGFIYGDVKISIPGYSVISGDGQWMIAERDGDRYLVQDDKDQWILHRLIKRTFKISPDAIHPRIQKGN